MNTKRKNGKQFKGWDPENERATYDADFYKKHQRYYERALPGMAAFIKENFPDAKSIMDIGCGTGEMLEPLVETHRVLGIDFSQGAREMLVIPSDSYLDHDLTKPLPAVDRFDVVLSLEVWEHIPEEFEDVYVHNLLVSEPKHLIVSCAAPGQWGRHHYNCGGPEHVVEKMKGRGYELDEELTSEWNKIKYLATFYKRNTLIFNRQPTPE